LTNITYIYYIYDKYYKGQMKSKIVTYPWELPEKTRNSFKSIAATLGVSMKDFLLYLCQKAIIDFKRGKITRQDLKTWKENGKSIV